MQWTDLLQFLGVARKEIMPQLVTDGEAMKSRTPDRGRVKDADIRAIKNDAATNSGLSGFVLFDNISSSAAIAKGSIGKESKPHSRAFRSPSLRAHSGRNPLTDPTARVSRA